ncbi:MAG: TetR/AcrR family transcriptional regulator [Candidatus Eiseniibacteriota bacterium]
MASSRLAVRPATKKEQRAASTEKLLAAALRLFVSQGYRHTTVDEIALASGLTKGAVYFYFRSKDTVLMTLFDRVEAVVVEPMVARVAAAGPTARDKFVAFIHGQAQLGVERADEVLLLVLMSLEFAGRGGAIEARLRAIYERMYDTVEEIIALGRKRGEFRSDLRLREQAAIIMGAHDGTFLEWYRRRSAFNGRGLTRALRVTLLQGLERLA